MLVDAGPVVQVKWNTLTENRDPITKFLLQIRSNHDVTQWLWTLGMEAVKQIEALRTCFFRIGLEKWMINICSDLRSQTRSLVCWNVAE